MKTTEYYSVSHEQITEKRKIIFQFILMSLTSVIAGFCFAHLLNEDTFNGIIKTTISDFYLNSKSTSFSELLQSYFKFCLPDILCIIIGLIFTFSFINYIISDIALIFLGFKFGINSALIKMAGFNQLGILSSLSYWLLKGCSLLIFTVYFCKLAFCSLEMKRFSRNGRVILNKKATLLSIVLTLSILGLTFIVNGIYFIFIYGLN